MSCHALKNLFLQVRAFGSKRSGVPARFVKKYNKARAIMGKRSDREGTPLFW